MPAGTNLQRLWASPVGSLIQGGVIDSGLGLAQVLAHMEGAAVRAGGRPDWDVSGRADQLVNDSENNLNQALRATGTNPLQYKAGRKAGEIGAGILMAALAPEAEIGALAKVGATRLAKRYAGEGFEQVANYAARKLAPEAAIDAAHDTLFKAVEQKDQGNYWSAKAGDAATGAVWGASKPILKAKGRQLLGDARSLAKETYDNVMDGTSAPDAVSGSAPAAGSPVVPAIAPLADAPVDGARGGGDSGTTNPSGMTSALPRSGDVALAALQQAYGPLDQGAPNMPPGLFGGWHYTNYPDYWDMA